MLAPLACVLVVSTAAGVQSPIITVDRDNVKITESCAVLIARSPIADADDNGVIQIEGDDITVDFGGQSLRGASEQSLPNTFTGIGVRITGRNVTLRGAAVSGYKVGIHAVNADGLTIDDCDVSDNFRQRLKSTPKAEDASDWLWPHENDANQWMTNYGAGLYIEDSNGVTVRKVKARDGQNGIILDRVNDSKIYDNDCSFLSGWGLAMWRSSRNIVSRNAFDFCVRGYSHGVYNRGQDSAGILMFEQCCDNLIIENSATHCGDGLFAFAGKAALGEKVQADESASGEADLEHYRRRGNNNNLIIANDFSDCAAHGLELTFSFGNRIERNRFASNAICGVWAGYSQDTIIHDNVFINCGTAGYGMERGGINIEHGRGNRITNNAFSKNACGVHLWWDEDENLLALPWTKANGADSADNVIANNTFDGDAVAVQLRRTVGTTFAGNTLKNVGKELDADEHSASSMLREVEHSATPPASQVDDAIGDTRPVGSRMHLTGRNSIVMTPWGPYDWVDPYLQRVNSDPAQHVYRVLPDTYRIDLRNVHVDGKVETTIQNRLIIIKPLASGTLVPYTIDVGSGGQHIWQSDVLIALEWSIIVFPYTADPREFAGTWNLGARKDGVSFNARKLDLQFGYDGPSQLRFSNALTEANLPKDRFGTIASTKFTCPPGQWRIRTLSDDGIRVSIGADVVIEDWTQHGPTEHTHLFAVGEPRTIVLKVEHFELDGYAVLKLDIERP